MNSHFNQDKLQGKADKFNCLAIATKSSKMFYLVNRLIEDRQSMCLCIVTNGKPSCIEIPLKELKLLSQDLNDILELYF